MLDDADSRREPICEPPRLRGSRPCSRRSRLRRGPAGRGAGAPRRAVAASRRGRTRGMERHRRSELLDELVRRDDDDEPPGLPRRRPSRAWGGAASLHEPARGGPPGLHRRSPDRAAGSRRRRRTLDPEPEPSRAVVSVATEVATQRRSSPRAARAGRRKATVEPILSPTSMPSSTSEAAASAGDALLRVDAHRSRILSPPTWRTRRSSSHR